MCAPLPIPRVNSILSGLMAVALNWKPWLYWIIGFLLVSLKPGNPREIKTNFLKITSHGSKPGKLGQ